MATKEEEAVRVKVNKIVKLILERSKSGRQIYLKQLTTKRKGLIDMYQTAVANGSSTEAWALKLTMNKTAILNEIESGYKELVSRQLRNFDAARTIKTVTEQPQISTSVVEKSIKRFDLAEFKGLIEGYFNFPFNDIISRSRKREYVDIRSILFPVLECLVGPATLSARILGGRDHSTALHNKQTFRNNTEVDYIYRQQAAGFIQLMIEQGYQFPNYLYKEADGQVYVNGFSVKPRTIPTKNEEVVSMKIKEAGINHPDYRYFEERKVLMLS